MHATASIEADVMNVMRTFADAYANHDKDRLLDLFCSEKDVVLLGSGAEECNVGINAVWRQIRRDWEQTDSLRMRFGWRTVSVLGQVAWMATDCYLFVKAGYRQSEIPLRMTVVLIETEDSWKIAQLHYSSPVVIQSEIDTCLE